MAEVTGQRLSRSLPGRSALAVVAVLLASAPLAGLALAPSPARADAAPRTDATTAAADHTPAADASLADASPADASAADVTPPTTEVLGGDDLWHNADVTLTFVATDETEGSGVAATFFAVDGGDYVAGMSLTIPAPTDHANDGAHTVSYYSVDNAGNSESPRARTVRIDTTGPVTELTATGGAAGVALVFSYRVSDDLSAGATTVRLIVRDGHGAVVKRFAWASRPAGAWLSVRWRPFSQDTYRVRLTAGDEAGNAQTVAATSTIFAKGPWWRTIGRSVQGRAIVATRFGSGARHVLYVGGAHGNELGSAVAARFSAYLVAHPKAVPFGARIEIVRCLNPDGLARRMRGNARRVDLNRNLPTRDWRSSLYAASEPAGSNLTGGASPGSEPETKALLALLKNGRFKAVVSLHSRAGIIICEGRGSRDLGRTMARLCGLPVGELSYERYITGSLGTYVPEKYGIPIVTVELRSATLTWGMASALVSIAR